MLNSKTGPKGADAHIEKLAAYLYKQLKALWKLSDSEFEAYGRCYRNGSDLGYVPEVFVSGTDANNTIYNGIQFDKTRMNALFFFSAGQREKINEGQSTLPVSIIFMVNITALKPAVVHRADEEIRNDVGKLISQGFHQFELDSIETGLKNVFREFDGYLNKDGQIFEDRHPLYCFRVNTELKYILTETFC